MALEVYMLNEHLLYLKKMYEDAVFSEKPVKELNKILNQIKHLERLIDESRERSDNN